MKRIEAAWESYRKQVIPASASPVQVNETRNGFYAGAWCLLSAVMGALEPGVEPTDGDERAMDEIYAELKAFAQSKRG